MFDNMNTMTNFNMNERNMDRDNNVENNRENRDEDENLQPFLRQIYM